MRCAYCLALTIQKLIQHAEVEFSGRFVPKTSYYQHYPSILDLEKSAEGGCDLCALMIYAFTEYRASDHWYYAGEHQTLLSAIKDWVETSSIRISIQANHVYSATPLDQVQMFDLLQIWAGDYEETSLDPEESSLQEPPTVYLQLLTTPARPLKIGRYDIGRFKTDVNLGSHSNFSIAKSWIDTCSICHQDCPSPEPTSFPTRIVDVGTTDEPNCRLFFPEAGFISRYAALSHCWGGPIQNVLTRYTLAEFQTRIPWADLSTNFQDAVTITRTLGLRYLWIDCLCIVQNEREDWAIESTKMADIYRNAFVTISAVSSPTTSHGILRAEPEPTNTSPAPVNIILSEGDETTVSVAAFKEGDISRVENLRKLFNDAPLSMRGWCLQEAVLSPRILHYGASRIYWKCSHGFQSSDGAYPGTEFPESELYPALSSVLYADLVRNFDSSTVAPLNKRMLMDEFYELVNQFTKRKLTFWMDKLPAFSGLAQKMHTAIGGTYLAGLWSEDIRRSLTWQKEMSWARHTKAYQAPSWSWATTNDLIYFNNPDLIEDKENLSLIESNIQLVDESNPYGAVKSGHIIVRGLTIDLWRTLETIEEAELDLVTDFGMALWDEPMFEGDVDRITMKHIYEVLDETTGQQLRLVEMIESEYYDLLQGTVVGLESVESKSYTALLVNKSSPSEEDAREGGFCIILERQGDSSIYKRVGTLSLFPYPLTRFKGWRTEMLKII